MFKRTKVSAAAALALGGMALIASVPALAQTTPEPQETQRIEITGSSIKRIDAETALPVQVITRKDIERTGAVNVEQLMQSISAISSSQTLNSASASGATTGGLSAISLRGLGSLRTLVLLNGRRIAPYGIGFVGDSVSVDVNSIPIGAIERIEILKDGASAIYGSDAIAGVVNFILRKDMQGGEFSVDYGDTSQGGASSTRLNGIYGIGDMATNHYNLMLMADYQKDKPLFGGQRPFSNTAIHNGGPGNPLNNDTTSGNTFPGNIAILNGPFAGKTGNPSAPACPGPYAVLDPLKSAASCRFDPASLVTLLPATEKASIFANLKVQLTSSLEGYAEGSFTSNRSTTVIQPVPLSDQFALPSNNPLYNQGPYNGNFPNNAARFGALAGTPTGLAPGSDAIVLSPVDKYYPTAYITSLIGPVTAANPLPAIAVRYRSVASGNRSITDQSSAPRLALGVRGDLAGWDFDSTLLHTQSHVVETVNSGYPLYSLLLPMLNSGNVNLFGSNDAATTAMLNTALYRGPAITTTSTLDSLAVKGSRDLFALAGGSAALALGAELRREKLDYEPSVAIQTGDVSGYGGNQLVTNKARSVEAAYAEFNAPLAKGLEVNAAVRSDHYEGVGNSVTPKVSLRWQPVKQYLLRASMSNGFRAPSLQDLFLPQTLSVTTTGLSDPLRCPTTQDGIRDCSTQFNTTNGGNAALQPEKSKNYTLGMVFEPTPNLSVAVDYWNIFIRNEIENGIDPSVILADPVKYASLIQRGAVQAAFPGLPGPITNILTTNINLGAEHVEGIDLDIKGVVPAGDIGKFTFDLVSTTLLRDLQQNIDGTYSEVIGSANTATGGAVVRYKHTLSANLTRGPWDYTLIQHFQVGYTDAGSSTTGTQAQVAAYQTWDFMATYSGIKDMRLRFGMRNLLNRAPPYSANPAYFQSGYDPSYGDPRGRYVTAGLTYSFK